MSPNLTLTKLNNDNNKQLQIKKTRKTMSKSDLNDSSSLTSTSNLSDSSPTRRMTTRKAIALTQPEPLVVKDVEPCVISVDNTEKKDDPFGFDAAELRAEKRRHDDNFLWSINHSYQSINSNISLTSTTSTVLQTRKQLERSVNKLDDIKEPSSSNEHLKIIHWNQSLPSLLIELLLHFGMILMYHYLNGDVKQLNTQPTRI
ncbi:hypothetical protein BDF19DRAFT_246198 [Syncephalis fuscata]|nr:hypothetical protein BDF19DRAFT_246198 [Syncephalis fuscata]